MKAAFVALACSDAPEGREHWTLKLLADNLVALEGVPSIAPEGVRATLQKTTSGRGKTSSGASQR